MAATNRVDILDPALLRPGRFDRRVNINIPDIKGREEILKVHAKNKPLSKEVDLKTIARITSGFTGAEIENLLNEAAILTAKENRKVITEEDIQKSMMKVTLGPQKKSRVISEQEKFNTAVHESGHAIIHKLAKEPTPVQEVSIIPRGGAGGYTLSADDDKLYYYKETLYSKIQSLLGGICAEKLINGDTSTGASSDLKRATSIAKRMVTEWGMSDELGLVYSGSDGDIFVGKNYQERMSYSESQASLVFSIATFVMATTTFITIFIYERLNRNRDKTLLIMFTAAFVFFLLVFFLKHPILNIVFIVLAVMSSNGAATMIWSVYCPSLRDTGMVSGATGFLDCLSYVGAAISTAVFGNAVNSIGWGNLILIWIGLMVVGIIVALPYKVFKKK
jgi:ATP-dependent metalloprotease FtsH